jgi:DNA-binding NtrC family response regulator
MRSREEFWMQKTIVVINANPDERRELCRLLERNHYVAAPMGALSELVKPLMEKRCDGLILDIDTLPVDNRFIGNLSRENPELCIIGISSRNFHPELEEAMRAHISACLSKPVNEDELIYWLKSLCGAEPRSRASPSAG